MISLAVALEFFRQWRAFSIEAMKIVAPTCPTFPKGHTKHGKYKKWRDGLGPVGLGCHYTGGPDGIASMRWGNENPMNTGSSWHCTVLDHTLVELEHLLQRYPLVKKYLKTTALLHADIKGTWHGNQLNDRLFGMENRNLGMLTEREGKIYRVAGKRKVYPKDPTRAVLIRGKWWESYTKEQLETNINIGKMLRAWRGDSFNPSYVIPHSLWWASKSDTGESYPMFWIREAVFSNVAVEDLDWLQLGYPASQTVPFVELTESHEGFAEPREDPEQLLTPYKPMEAIDFDKIAGENWRDYLPAVRENLAILGAHIPDTEETHMLEPRLRLATETFQHGTRALKESSHLRIDGVPGKSTRGMIEKRLRRFGYAV